MFGSWCSFGAATKASFRPALLASFLLLISASVSGADDLEDCNAADTRPEAAIPACSAIIDAGKAKGHDLAVAYRNRGTGYFKKGENDNALADMERAIALDPNYALGYRGRGTILGMKGDLDRAIADLTETIRLDPAGAIGYGNRGTMWKIRGDFDRAITDYDEAIRLDPEYALAYSGRGSAHRAKGDNDRAVADLDEAIRLDPKSALAYNGRGNAYAAKGDNDRAIADYDEAIRLDPKFAIVYSNRGNAYADKRDNDRAIADYDEAIRLDPKLGVPYVGRGNMYRAKGDNDRAIADYDEAIRLDPKHALAYNNRGLFYADKRDNDRAIAEFTEAIRLDPGFTGALAHRGLIYEAKHDLDRARADFQAVLALPFKYDNGTWAHDTAQTRLSILAAWAPVPVPPKAPPPVAAPANTKPAAVATGPNPVPSPPAIISPSGPVGEKLALVIGNGAYRNAPTLPNPPTDARAIAKALRDNGFQVFEATDLDRVSMERALLEFLQKAPAAKVRLLFYAGHGMQVDGNNYLVPIDATVKDKGTALYELVDVDRLLKGLDDESHANVIILDACRDNPFESHLSAGRSVGRGSGLSGYESVGSGTLIAFATAPGNVAADGSGDHSPFTAALLKHIGSPKLELNQMLTRVRIDVAAATEKKQIPWVNSSLLGEVYLAQERRLQ